MLNLAPSSCSKSATGPRSHGKGRLELLPVELRIAILFSCPDLETIRLLVHASPAYHQAYRRIRRKLLLHRLYAEYDGAVDLPDAIVAVRSRGLYAEIPSNKERIYSLLDQWRRHAEIRRLDLPSARDLPDKPGDTEEIIQLLRLHKVMTFCFNDFCNTVTCPGWIDPAQWKTDFLPISLSRNEKIRFFRGLYRMQIYGNIFGFFQARPVYEKTRIFLDDWVDNTFTLEEAWRIFFGTMTPWEFQEYSCAWHYINRKYTQPFTEVAEYFHQFGRRLMEHIPKDQIDPLPDNCVVCHSHDLLTDQDSRQPALATMGPLFFYEFIPNTEFLHRRDLILVNSPMRVIYFPDEIEPAEGMEEMLPLLYPADRFTLSDDLNETKSSWAAGPPTQRPNVACERLFFAEPWHTEFFAENVYSTMFDNDNIWRWAYAIWDAGMTRGCWNGKHH